MSHRTRVTAGLVLFCLELIAFNDRTPATAPGLPIESLAAPSLLLPRVLLVLSRGLAGLVLFAGGHLLTRGNLAGASPFPLPRLAVHIAFVAAHWAFGPATAPWLWTVTALAAVASAAWTFLPLAVVRQLTPAIGAGALGVAAIAASSARIGRAWWESPDASALTFSAALGLLRWIDPSAHGSGQRLGLAHFTVRVGYECAGYSGVVLFSAFAALWLLSFRREYRFPAALILLPVGALLSWVLNVVRIVTLVLIGNAGYKNIAIDGFHTHAGWIFFTLLASGFCLASAHIPGIGAVRVREAAARNPVAVHLAPFVALHVAAMVSGAASSGGFEPLYPLRWAAMAAAIAWRWRDYAAMLVLPGRTAAAAGAAVFVAWVALVPAGPPDPGPLPRLAAWDSLGQGIWWFCRITSAIVLVPFAEELAFRGFLQRRVHGPDFEDLDPRRTGWLAIAVSSLLFGAMHESRWIAGSAAGLAYGLLYRHTGQISSAVAAHAFTNLLLIALVLATGDWRYW